MKLADIRNRIRNLAWPLDTTGTIAVLALVVSAIQLVVTAPMLSELFVSPSLVAVGSGSDPKAQQLTGTYIVRNEGNAPATKVEIGMGLQTDQRLMFLPNLVTNVVEEKGAVLVKNVRIEIERLLPDEQMVIIVIPGKDGNRLGTGLADFMVQGGITDFPTISYLRSAEGRGKIERRPLPPIPTHEQTLVRPSSQN